jgi:hypothetical protein
MIERTTIRSYANCSLCTGKQVGLFNAAGESGRKNGLYATERERFITQLEYYQPILCRHMLPMNYKLCRGSAVTARVRRIQPPADKRFKNVTPEGKQIMKYQNDSKIENRSTVEPQLSS